MATSRVVKAMNIRGPGGTGKPGRTQVRGPKMPVLSDYGGARGSQLEGRQGPVRTGSELIQGDSAPNQSGKVALNGLMPQGPNNWNVPLGQAGDFDPFPYEAGSDPGKPLPLLPRAKTSRVTGPEGYRPDTGGFSGVRGGEAPSYPGTSKSVGLKRYKPALPPRYKTPGATKGMTSGGADSPVGAGIRPGRFR